MAQATEAIQRKMGRPPKAASSIAGADVRSPVVDEETSRQPLIFRHTSGRDTSGSFELRVRLVDCLWYCLAQPSFSMTDAEAVELRDAFRSMSGLGPALPAATMFMGTAIRLGSFSDRAAANKANTKFLRWLQRSWNTSAPAAAAAAGPHYDDRPTATAIDQPIWSLEPVKKPSMITTKRGRGRHMRGATITASPSTSMDTAATTEDVSAVPASTSAVRSRKRRGHYGDDRCDDGGIASKLTVEGPAIDCQVGGKRKLTNYESFAATIAEARAEVMAEP
jgi:hypothetical protein